MIDCITFILYNLLNGAESAVWQSRIRPGFLTLNLHNYGIFQQLYY
ncbi:hypothetical protein MKU65_05915 [Leptospira interrogans]|nr:hypothetical protein [Leptospira interrogans]MCH1902254.1 hypothetical protein [Leptospira interrogans]